ncbi:MAG TPA: GlsB/YeaQ/YmgE family stress response membrane protein [Gammaproteobacteria bacterium]|nr:GlsB/YeaQ/YmgE family stress response membrane protein [Gammaproteobacteria bacterium]
MTIISWLLAGGLVGWAAGLYMGTPNQHAFIFNASFAALGAAVGTWVLGPMLGVSPGLSVFGVLVGAFCGAVTLVLVHFVRRHVTT